MDTITATLATIPGREAALAKAVESLLPQCSRVNVVCNYADNPIPSGLVLMAAQWSNLFISLSDNSWGDAAKFAFSSVTEGYQLFCDDDLLYPPWYAAHMVAKVEQYNRKAAISLHGSIIAGHVGSYYQHRQQVGACLFPLAQDVRINVPGTGCLALHSSLLRVPLDSEIFPTGNMADIHFAVLCQQKRIPCVCAEHLPLKYLQDEMHGRWTIWDQCARIEGADADQTEAVNAWKDWRVYE